MLPQTGPGWLNQPQSPLVRLLDHRVYGQDWQPRAHGMPEVASDFFEHTTKPLSFLPPQTIRIHRQVFTPANATPMTPTIHWTGGLGGCTGTEEAMAFEAMELGIRVVLYDLPGCGLSDGFRSIHDTPLTIANIEDSAAMYIAIEDCLFEAITDDAARNPGNFFPGGNSLGGVITNSIAHRFQEGALAERFKGVLNCVTFMSNGANIPPSKKLVNYLRFMEGAKNLHDISWVPLFGALLVKAVGAYATIQAFSPSYISHTETLDLLQRSLRPHWPSRDHGDQWLQRISERAIAQGMYAMLAERGIRPVGLDYQLVAQQKLKRPLIGAYARRDPLLAVGDMQRAYETHGRSLFLVTQDKADANGPSHLLLGHHPKALATFYASVVHHLNVHDGSEPFWGDVSGFEADGVHTTQRYSA